MASSPCFATRRACAGSRVARRTRLSSGGPEANRTTSAALTVRFIGHATALIAVGGVRVLTDPFLRPRLGPLQRHGPLPRAADLSADIVLISHGHPDHYDPRSIDSLPGRPTIVLPRGLGARMRRDDPSREVVELRSGEAVEIAGLPFRAVPARHWISPGAPRAQPVGYVFGGAERVYFAGDTGRFPAMAEAVGDVDVALLPVWSWGPHLGPGHLGPRSAAEVARDIRPTTVIPIHWGTLYPRQLHRVWLRPLAEPGDRFAWFARALAPDVDVRVLRPGELTTIELDPTGTRRISRFR